MAGGAKYLDAAEQARRWVAANRSLPTPVLYDGTPGESLFLDDPAEVEVLQDMLRDTGLLMSAGLLTGAAGIGFVLSELGADPAPAVQVLREAAVVAEGGGVHWGGLTDLVTGAAGTVLFLAGRGGDEGADLAREGCRWLVSQAQPTDDGGLRWGMGAEYEGWPFMPNLSHGTAGIAYALATVGQQLGDDELVEAALRGGRHLLSIARTDGGTCHVVQHVGVATELYPYGWCHGPTGLASLFRRLELASGDVVWGEWVRRAAHTVRTSGIPERREPGFWDNVARCCGSTGVAELFLDLHQLHGDDDLLAFAIEMTDDILDRATVDESGMRWSNIEHTADPPELPAEAGLMQGASGIGLWLVRLGSFLEGDERRVSWPWSPFV